jgi:ankyrin repeat protein
MKESCDHLICVQDGKTPLHLACDCGVVGLVSQLLVAGAQVDAQDKVSVCLSTTHCLFSSIDRLPSIMLALEVMWRS